MGRGLDIRLEKSGVMDFQTGKISYIFEGYVFFAQCCSFNHIQFISLPFYTFCFVKTCIFCNNKNSELHIFGEIFKLEKNTYI